MSVIWRDKNICGITNILEIDKFDNERRRLIIYLFSRATVGARILVPKACSVFSKEYML